MADPIGIVGGGIGGLTLAVALERAGLAAEVVERRPAFGERGAGIVLGPNAVAVLKGLGRADALFARGREVGEGHITDASGHRLMSIAYRAPAGERLPALALHRAELHEVLRESVSAPVHLGTTVTDFTDTHGGVEVQLSTGARRRWSVLVGADGIGSDIRRRVAGEVTPRYSGYTCWRCVVPVRVARAVEMWGRGRRVGVVPLADDRAYAFFTANAPRGAPAPWPDLDGFRAFFRGFGEPARSVTEALESLDDLRHDDLEDLFAERWSRGRLVLLGDAAHAMTPNLGQGAGMAIEDAAALARALQLAPDFAEALARYESLRRPRVRQLHRRSWWLGRVAQAETRLGAAVRNAAARWSPESVGRAQVSRLVEGVPQLPEARPR